MSLLNIMNRGKTLEQLGKRSGLQGVTNFVLASCLLVSVIGQYNSRERIVLVPPNIDRSVTVGWSSADGNYVKSFGLYAATLAGNITPKNVRFVVDNLSTMVSPRIYSEVRNKLLSQAESQAFVRNAVATTFMPDSVKYEPETSKVFVTGTVSIKKADGMENNGEMTYEIKVKMIEGKPVIDAINNYEGSEARTIAWLEAHRNDPNKMKTDK